MSRKPANQDQLAELQRLTSVATNTEQLRDGGHADARDMREALLPIGKLLNVCSVPVCCQPCRMAYAAMASNLRILVEREALRRGPADYLAYIDARIPHTEDDMRPIEMMLTQPQLTGPRGAVFSPCGLYRYALWRVWDAEKPPLVFCMLNPSTADADTNDPTVERCERRARQYGHGGVVVVNAYAYRSTDPKALREVEDAVGPRNDEWISYCAGLGPVVAAWGVHVNSGADGREQRLRDLLPAALCLGRTKAGHPRHPLYVSYKTLPSPWKAPDA